MRVLGQILRFFDRIDRVVFFGAGVNRHNPKKANNRLKAFLNWLDYSSLLFLDWLDTKVFFRGCGVKTKSGRVRSNGEKRITDFFDRQGIAYVYEKALVLDGIRLKPDFYLPAYNVYVEFWGMADISQRYQRIMAAKKKLYKKHSVPVISIYPRHISNLEESFPSLFNKATGKHITLKQKGG